MMCLSKILGIIAVICLASAVSPPGDAVDPAHNWVQRQYHWLKRYWKKDLTATGASPVTINPILLWLGVLLSIAAILFQ
jgi:hypothetical protein